MRAVGRLLTLAVLAPAAALAQTQTTPWGDPDLQGVWSNQTPVPLASAGEPIELYSAPSSSP